MFLIISAIFLTDFRPIFLLYTTGFSDVFKGGGSKENIGLDLENKLRCFAQFGTICTGLQLGIPWGYFSHFLNCTNDIKSRKASQIMI